MFRLCYDLPDDISRRFDFMDQAHGVARTHRRNTCVPLFHSRDDLTSQLFTLCHYLIIAPVPLCRKIVAQHTVSNGRREWESESQVINFGEHGIVCARLDHALFFPVPCTRFLARIEPCSHPGTFGPKHEHCRKSSSISNASCGKHRDITSNIQYRCHHWERTTVTCMPTSLGTLGHEHIHTCIGC